MRCNLGNSSCQNHQNQTSSAHFSWWQGQGCWNTFIFTSSIYHVLECLSLQNTWAAFSTHDFSHCHFCTGSQANPSVQTLFIFLSNTLQLLHLCNLLYGIPQPNGKPLWSLSPKARHSCNAPQMCALWGNQRSLGMGRWGWWETKSVEHPSHSAHYDTRSAPTKPSPLSTG